MLLHIRILRNVGPHIRILKTGERQGFPAGVRALPQDRRGRGRRGGSPPSPLLVPPSPLLSLQHTVNPPPPKQTPDTLNEYPTS